MKTISFTLLAISATVIVANPGTEKESSGINLRGSASSVQDFQTYIKAQYLDAKNHEFLEDAAEASPGTTCRREGSGCHIYDTVRPCCSGVCNRAKSFTPFGYCASAAAVEKVDKLMDTTESEAKEKVTIASRIDAQKFLEETEKASLGTNYCRGGGSPCYTYNSHFCCSGVCNRAQSGSPFGYCASTAAVENVDELMDEVDKTRMVYAQKFLEEAEEASLGSNYCRGNDSACYTYNSHFCCSGVCIRHQSGSPFGYCAPAATVENRNELMDTTKSREEEEFTKNDSIEDQKFIEKAKEKEASTSTRKCFVNGSICYDSDLCCSGLCKRQPFSPRGAPGTCAPSTDIVEDQEFLEDTEEDTFSPPKCSESGIACYTFGNNACCSGVCKSPPDGSFYGHCA